MVTKASATRFSTRCPLTDRQCTTPLGPGAVVFADFGAISGRSQANATPRHVATTESCCAPGFRPDGTRYFVNRDDVTRLGTPYRGCQQRLRGISRQPSCASRDGRGMPGGLLETEGGGGPQLAVRAVCAYGHSRRAGMHPPGDDGRQPREVDGGDACQELIHP